jgi:hypothetical protein
VGTRLRLPGLESGGRECMAEDMPFLPNGTVPDISSTRHNDGRRFAGSARGKGCMLRRAFVDATSLTEESEWRSRFGHRPKTSGSGRTAQRIRPVGGGQLPNAVTSPVYCMIETMVVEAGCHARVKPG